MKSTNEAIKQLLHVMNIAQPITLTIFFLILIFGLMIHTQKLSYDNFINYCDKSYGINNYSIEQQNETYKGALLYKCINTQTTIQEINESNGTP